ncbi:PadR family transcriptional regulator [Plantibacter sp. VKM Ac-2876]|uniref:PadR family transcriptional regulator n=1 Tax=Plantibacter sp. VKM Ac-2876 TaxID=2783826 RepID=UPI00188AFE8F|nr:PadR family transcriptional regulator [Plantibacter sp. VKM Ac-2876]MBF4563615.1 PadR family transcriptional regulator [Plantibacter sp. VKM Ac-2876]
MGTVKPLGMLAVAALGYLAERPMHPYEMYQLALHRQEDRVVKVSPGSLYRAVYALEADGLVVASGVDREGARPERTTFEITERGRHLHEERLRELLSTPTNEYPEFGLALSEAHELDAEEVRMLLETRILRQRAELADLERRMTWALEREIPRVYWMNVPYSAAMLRAEIAHLESLLAEIADGALVWHVPGTRAPLHEQAATPPVSTRTTPST